MRFGPPLIEARLIRRYKRFLADVEFPSGEVSTVVCPNTGSMMGVCTPGSRVWLTYAPSPTRKYAYTWELVEVLPGVLAGINTSRPNALVEEAVRGGVIGELAGYKSIRREVKFGIEGSRIDLLLEGGRRRKPCYVEVKNVTAAVDGGVALFPDTVSTRATKHLRELMHVVDAGSRAVLLFCVQRGDVDEVRPADAIDAAYGGTLREALCRGVEVLAYRAAVSVEGIVVQSLLPVVCP